VERVTDRNTLGEGVNNSGLMGSNVIVARSAGVEVGGSGVSVSVAMAARASGVSVDGVVVGANVLRTNRLGVYVGSREYGVAVGFGKLAGTGVCRNGIEIGDPLQPDKTKIMTSEARHQVAVRTRTKMICFIAPLRR